MNNFSASTVFNKHEVSYYPYTFLRFSAVYGAVHVARLL